MNILTTAVPAWVSYSFLIALSVAIYKIAKVAQEGAKNAKFNPKQVNKVFFTVIGFYALFFAYVFVASINGLFSENTLPPKILFITTVPLLLFFSLVVFNLTSFKKIQQHLSLDALVKIHLFRLIGVFFLITNAYGAIPTKFAYIAGIGDILTAVTSIFVAKAIISKKTYAKTLTLGWNIFGICDILSVVISALITTKVSIETGSQGLAEMANFPFCFIPAFAPATILFLHIAVFKKLWAERNGTN
jgi:hypothetical protein